ncbi:MAG: hypothetical protein R3C53_10410 [Pirellulaceae bacterium]
MTEKNPDNPPSLPSPSVLEQKCCGPSAGGSSSSTKVDEQPIAGVKSECVEYQPHLMMRRATWCGIVFALAVLLTALNLVPPVDVRYTLTSQIVVSEARLTAVEAVCAKHSRQLLEDQTAGLIRRIRVLDRGVGDVLDKHDAAHRELALVEIDSLWLTRCDEQTYAAWLDNLTRSAEEQAGTTEHAANARFARWELETARHYAARHQFLAARPIGSSNSDGRTFQLAAAPESDRISATLASRQTSSASGLELAPSADLEQLERQVEAAQRKVAETELACQRQIEQSSGPLRITGGPVATPSSTTIPFWLAASVLVLGLAAGSTAGWLQHRLQSGGVYDPEEVARQLQSQGLPLSGTVELSSESLEATDWMAHALRKSSETSRLTARQLTRISEWVLGFWCILIFVRLLSDPMWRGVFIESPLAALGRLLAGMP